MRNKKIVTLDFMNATGLNLLPIHLFSTTSNTFLTIFPAALHMLLNQKYTIYECVFVCVYVYVYIYVYAHTRTHIRTHTYEKKITHAHLYA